MFRHFKTRKEALRHISEVDPTGFAGLVIQKGKGKKPFKVGTRLSFLHFS